MSRIGNVVRRALGRGKAPDHITVAGSIIPSPDRRWCGPEFKNDEFYLRSAENEANRLIEHCRCTTGSRVMDVGCGQGRLPIGLLRTVRDLDYLGFDVDQRSIDWCKTYIQCEHPSFRFEHLDVFNERYNTGGRRMEGQFQFPVAPATVDIIYLYSVFSHTTEQEMRRYLGDFARILKDGGRVFFTTFVEEGVPNVSINPENYRLRCIGPLHVVRYEKGYLFSLLESAGYTVEGFSHGTETDGQSAIYLGRNRAATGSSR